MFECDRCGKRINKICGLCEDCEKYLENYIKGKEPRIEKDFYTVCEALVHIGDEEGCMYDREEAFKIADAVIEAVKNGTYYEEVLFDDTESE